MFQLNMSPLLPEKIPTADLGESVSLREMYCLFLPLPCDFAFTGEWACNL